jgi:phage terminase large subunit-like protein
MAQNLTALGIKTVNTPQGNQLTGAIRRKMELIATGQLCHGHNKILTWMASNYVLRHGLQGEVRPDKDKAADKIDGQVALDMLFDCIIRQPKDSTPSAGDLVAVF